MPRYTPERQQSDIRISTLSGEIWRAIGAVRDRHPDLSYEEVLASLNQVSTRAVGYLLTADDQTETTDAQR